MNIKRVKTNKLIGDFMKEIKAKRLRVRLIPEGIEMEDGAIVDAVEITLSTDKTNTIVYQTLDEIKDIMYSLAYFTKCNELYI